MNRQESIRAIGINLHSLGEIELEILALIAGRLAMGQKQYGKFQKKEKRNLVRETFEEVLDTAVYAARRLLLL